MRPLLEKLDSRSYDELISDLECCLSSGCGPYRVSFLNAHAVNIAMENSDFYLSLLGSECLLRDGVGVEIALLSTGAPTGENFNGTDFIPKLLSQFSGKRLALLGSEDGVLAQASVIIVSRFAMEVVTQLNGYDFSTAEYVEAVRVSSPDVVLLAMGMPKQEILAREIKESVPECDCLVVSGGAVLSFISGNELRAPKVLSLARLEWLWRFANDPKRLFRRYFIGNCKFLLRVFGLWRKC